MRVLHVLHVLTWGVGYVGVLCVVICSDIRCACTTGFVAG